jgi:hypothetical protein
MRDDPFLEGAPTVRDDEKTRDQLIADLNQMRIDLQTFQEKLLDMGRSSRKTQLKSLKA